MSAGTEEATSAPSLEDFLSSAFDGSVGAAIADIQDESAPLSEGEENATGDTPAEPAPGSDETQPAPEDDVKDENAEALAANALASSDPNAKVETDPLANAQPLSYTVNGQARTFDDIKVLGEHGGIITADALPKLQQRLAERDHLFETGQERYNQYQALEKLTEWKVKGADGADRTLVGRDALEARDISHGRLAAALDTITAAFQKSPLDLLTTDANSNIVWNADAIQNMVTRSELAELNAQRSIEQRFRALGTTESNRSVPVDLAQAAPTLVDVVAKQMNVTNLAPEDRAFLSGLVPRFVRQATAEDVRENPKLTIGEQVIDPAFNALVQRESAKRADAAKSVVAASAVTKENAARLAAAAQGNKTIPRQAKVPPTTKRSERDQASDDAFSMMERAASGRFASRDQG